MSEGKEEKQKKQQMPELHISNKAKAAAAIIALVLLLLCAGYLYYHNKVLLMQYSDGISAGEAFSEEESAADAAAMAEEMAKLEAAEAVMAEGDVVGSSDVFNILLIGTDERTRDFNDNARGDSIMLASINKKTMVIHLVSFERGMGVPILDGQYQGQWDWLTHTFRYGGADLMMREIEECFKIKVDYYLRANFNTFEQLINAVGGVDIELTELEAQGLNGEVQTNARTHTTVHAGMNHLDGYDALQYSRLRYTDSDWKRIERQRNVIQTVIGQCKGLGVLELNDLLNTVLPLLKTNLTENEITGLLLAVAPNISKVTVEQMTVPAQGTYGVMTGMGGRSLYAVDFKANAELLHQALYGSPEQ